MSQEKAYDDKDMEKKILMPYTHVLPAQSNFFLDVKIPDIFNHWLQLPEDKMVAIKDITKTVLTSIILFDDIQDDSLFRRTLPAAHCVYGVPLALNASIHVLLLGLDKVLKLGHPKAAEIFSQRMLDYMHGQGADIYWRDNYVCPSEEEYKQMAVNKIGSFVLLTVQLMQLFSENKMALEEIIAKFAIYFTIRDDFCNINRPEALEERSRTEELQVMKDTHFCEDLTEGKFSWPIIHALKSAEAPSILNILKQRTRDVKKKQQCLSMMEKAGSLQYSRGTLTVIDLELREMISHLGGNPLFQDLLDDLLNWNDDAK